MTKNNQLAQSYNDFPYKSLVYDTTQPTKLQAIAKMKGLSPAPLENAKILEIGCSFGGNLIPFAIKYPNSQIIGIDLSEHQVNTGRQVMKEIGIDNIHLIAADITNVTFDDLKFDYIICHGVFSWVPEFVQEGILSCIQKYLSPNGVAFISYNTYPGWHLKDMAKKLMLFGSDKNLDKMARVEQSFEMLKYTGKILERNVSFIANEVNNIFNHIVSSQKYYVAHEYFEEFNEPMYFCDFIEKIKKYNLGYVADTNMPNLTTKFIFRDQEYQDVCQYFNNNVEKIEQYSDFVVNRAFRCSIITHQQNLIDNDIHQEMEKYEKCHFFYDLFIQVENSDIEFIELDDKKVWKVSGDGLDFSSNPLSDALFNYLKQQNSPKLINDIVNEFKDKDFYDEKDLINILFFLIHSHRCYLTYTPEERMHYGEKPHMLDKYRNMILFDYNNPTVIGLANDHYRIVNFNHLVIFLIQYLDGNHTIDDLVDIIKNAIETDVLNWEGYNGTEENMKEEIKKIILQNLDMLVRNGFFNHY